MLAVGGAVLQEIVARRAVWVTLVLFVLLWTVIPTLLHSAPPLDVVESGTWGRELVLTSYKHPNLPGLLIEATYMLSGQYGWPQYLLSACAGALTVWLIFLLGKDLFGAPAGAAGAVLLFGCYYFTWPIPEFNHNIAQLPIWAAVTLLLWRAVRDDRPWLWLMLGLVAGVGLYAKLSMLSLIAAGGIWLLVDASARTRLLGLWPWVGLLVFASTAAPLAWLVLAGDGSGLVQFVAQSGAQGGGPIGFLLAQLADLVPMLVAAAVALALPRRRQASVVSGVPDLARVRLYLAIMFFLPLLTAAAAAVTTGAKDMWGTPMLNLAGLGLVACVPSRFDAVAVRRVFAAAFVLLAVAAGSFAMRYVVTASTAASPLRTQWPQLAMVSRLTDIWKQQTDAPLRIVGGNDWVAGLVSLALKPRGSVFVQLNPALSPWVSSERVQREGMLVVWNGDDVPAYAEDLIDDHVHGVESFAWSTSDAARPLRIGYVVVPPVD